MDNPLLAGGLPAFSEIRPEHALPAIEQRLAEYRQVIEDIEKLGPEVDYNRVLVAETLADNDLANTFSAISHLNSVNNTPEWREAYEACLEPMTRFDTERGHNRKLWAAYEALSERDDFADQDIAVQASIKHELRDFHLAGVDLPVAERERFGEISIRLSELGNRFGNHVLDATEAFSESFDDVTQLAGLPKAELDLLAGMARDAGTRPAGWPT